MNECTLFVCAMTRHHSGWTTTTVALVVTIVVLVLIVVVIFAVWIHRCYRRLVKS